MYTALVSPQFKILSSLSVIHFFIISTFQSNYLNKMFNKLYRKLIFFLVLDKNLVKLIGKFIYN